MEKDIPIFFKKVPGTKKTKTEVLTQKVEEALSDLVGPYLIQVKEDFYIMKNLLVKASQASSEDRFSLIRNDFFVKMHDLKGQGATFGYPLLTEIGSFACDFLRNKKEITVSDLDTLRVSLSDIDLVLKNNLTGTGGTMGEDIRHRLEQRKNV